ncbi:trigger factor [Leucobacter sp. OLJS4]|uniref:trigger factor n=1 Tax=unclassified Leucobacter TaxID=2621730 RepID=UPI000C17BFF1|nr:MULTISPECIES: trigger factor [unclassified Leucobacter]PIJ44746.1 trigger factor [Leucobacter sp. OLES1]PII81491.1 trigger factor [Leucobacter sp. OLCALW19]PII86161.1 trigger factor [Leucobacter sp. OLTLW20]PII90056.1 trigger factor [Leucobacter sp. OLAS13]PII97089.1 trigger factor [Leucobacter sp. OLDS2]
MPKTNAEKLTPTRVKLTVALTMDELEPHLKGAYKTISEQVSIPGFRKGKVPAPIIDQRVGREAVVEQAVNSSLDEFYQAAVAESDVRPMGRPTADVEQWIDLKDPKSEVVLAFEVEVRPEFTVPKYDGLKLTVDNAEVGDDAVDAELDKLRERFGTLETVERAAAKGDFVEIDLTATIDGTEVDQAQGVSYEVGAGNMLVGLDEAIDTLTAGESTTFTSQLLGGEYEGQDAEVAVTVTAVKERKLAEADDDFAQLASEFDTVAELRESLAEQVAQAAVFAQGRQARDLFTETLIEQAGIPISEELVEDEVHRHLEGEGRLEDDEHRAEVRESSEKQLQLQLLLDAIVEAEEVTPTEAELSQYIFQSAQQYGMEPGQFIQALSQGGQMGIIVAEVTRNKALAIALAKAEVVDQDGNAVDLTEFTAVDNGEDSADEAEAPAEEKKPAAKKAPAKKAPAKKAAEAAGDDDEEAKKAARSAAAKKAAATRAAKKAAAEAAAE